MSEQNENSKVTTQGEGEAVTGGNNTEAKTLKQPDFSQMKKNKKKGLRGFLHGFFRVILILLLVILVINIVIVAVVSINHKNKLADERGFLMPTGQMVEVNGYSLHTIVTGNLEADNTLVFIHSNGITDDSVALQPLFAKLGDYRLAYVDRSGYGYSDNPKVDKDIDSIIEETRTALTKAGVSGPYILVSNGIAGLEATYWAKKYPDEVAGIVGINISIAEEFDGITEEQYCGVLNYLMTLFSKIGGHRFVKSVYPDNLGAIYTEKQMLVRKALISKGFYTSGMYEEDLQTIANAAIVKQAGWPEDTPILNLLSNPLMEPYITDDASVREEYESALEEVYGTDSDAIAKGEAEVGYVEEFNAERKKLYEKYSNIDTKEIAGPSRLYTYNPDAVASEIVEFIQDIAN